MAERAGFEPAVRVNVRTLSKRVPSATQPPLREGVNRIATDIQNASIIITDFFAFVHYFFVILAVLSTKFYIRGYIALNRRPTNAANYSITA